MAVGAVASGVYLAFRFRRRRLKKVADSDGAADKSVYKALDAPLSYIGPSSSLSLALELGDLTSTETSAASAPASPVSSKGSALTWNKLEPSGLLGQGSFSAVVRARDVLRQKDVAVKVFKHLRHEGMRDREFTLAREVQSFDPAHTTCVLGKVDGQLGEAWLTFLRSASVQGFSLHSRATAEGIVSRLEAGGTLSELLHSPDRPCSYWTLPLEERLRLLKEVAEGLTMVHKNSITHGDLKSDNILLSDNVKREVRLTDYGLSKMSERENESRLTSTVAFGGHGGTEAYKAPEMDIDGVANSRTTDMYSFGVIAWEVLSGKRPSDQYARMGPYQRLEALKNGKQPLDPADVKDNVPQDVKDLVRQCLKYSSSESGSGQDRPKASEALQVLNAALQQQRQGKYDIFISYNWGPAKQALDPAKAATAAAPVEKVYPRQLLALEIYRELNALGYTVWLDIFDMGVSLSDSMQQGIKSSKCVVVLLSPEYVKSRNCRYEVDFAVQQKKPLVICMVCDPDKDIWPRMAEPEFADVCGPAKLNIAGKMYCNMGPAAALDWSEPLSDAQRALLTKAQLALPLLRGSLEKMDVKPSGGEGGIQRVTRATHIAALREHEETETETEAEKAETETEAEKAETETEAEGVMGLVG